MGEVLTNMHLKGSAVKEIKKRMKQLQKVEQEVVELEELVILLAEYIQEQDEWINQIEHGIQTRIIPQVEAGKKQLEAARRLKSGSRKKKVLLFALFAAGFAAMTGFVVSIFR